jgi:hypothetical protein
VSRQLADRISRLADGGFSACFTGAQLCLAWLILVASPLVALVPCLFYMVLLHFFAGVVAGCCHPYHMHLGTCTHNLKLHVDMQVAKRVSKLADGGFNTYVTDAQRGYTVILLAGPLAALVLCLIYMVLLRFFAGVVAWAVVILINLLCAAMTLIAAYKGELLMKLPALSKLNEFMAKTGSTMDGACFPPAESLCILIQDTTPAECTSTLSRLDDCLAALMRC